MKRTDLEIIYKDEKNETVEDFKEFNLEEGLLVIKRANNNILFVNLNTVKTFEIVEFENN